MKKKDRGIALITVLLSLALIGVLVSSISIAGNITYRVGLINVKSIQNQYAAESRMSRAIWDMNYELKIHTNRKLGFQSELDTEEDGEVRLYADGQPIIETYDDKIVTLKYHDANQGFDLSGTINSSKVKLLKAAIKLPFEADPAPVDDFIDKLIDYTDRNDLFQNEGMEREQYEDEFGVDLPRNSPMEFAEEALWVPGIEEAIFSQKEYQEMDLSQFEFKVQDYLRVIPYRGVNFPRSSKSNFFAATDYQIMLHGELDEAQMEEVREARRLWYSEKINIQETIPEIYMKLSRVFSFNESKIYRIQVQVSQNDSGASVNQEVIFSLAKGFPRYRPDTFSGLRYWRKVNF
ncbi:MAG: hypothetical protein NE334_12100 [Lentisphaeraceae bacterium]|nr:hypothetical protein [Lentisphaeraceae bacterium]